MFSGGYAPFCVCWLNINFKLTCLREHMHFVKILQKRRGKRKTCTSSSDLPMRVIVAFFYIVEAYMFHQVCISLSILPFLLDENLHLMSICCPGFLSYLFASLEFMILMRTITFSPFNFYEFEVLNGIMTSIVIGPRISPCLVLNICFKIKFVKEKFSYTFDGLGSLLWIFF